MNKRKEVITTCAIIILCLILFIAFPTRGDFQKIASNITFLIFLPILYIKMILKKKLSDFGLQIGDYKRGLLWGILSLCFVAAFIFVASKFKETSKDYHDLFYTRAYFILFIVRELALGITFILLDFFFRGFVMLYFASILKEKFLSIGIQFALFTFFILLTAKLNWVSGSYIFLSIFAGIIAYKSRSILYSSLFLWISIIVIELSMIKLFFSN